jgi:hypothetical protein
MLLFATWIHGPTENPSVLGQAVPVKGEVGALAPIVARLCRAAARHVALRWEKGAEPSSAAMPAGGRDGVHVWTCFTMILTKLTLLTRPALCGKLAGLFMAIFVAYPPKGPAMSKRLLLLLLTVTMVFTTVAANVSLARNGPPPRCNTNPQDPRCRDN